MTDQTPEVKQNYNYQTDQQVSVNAYLEIAVNGEPVKFQVTSRYGASPEKIVKTTEAAITAYSMLRVMYPKPEATTASAPQASNVESVGGLSLNISKIKVTPEVKDGKPRIMVELFEANHQWADIKAFYDNPTQASAAFSDVTGLDFSTAGEYSLNCIADYRESEKKNKNGKPYKNLVNVRAA